MNALELLKSDHTRVQSLFKQIESEKGSQQKRLLFNNIRDDLETHAYIEEMIFYPALKDRAELAELVNHSYDEHKAVRELLSEIEEIPLNNPEFTVKLDRLVHDVEAHIAVEEAELFPKARELLSQGQLQELGRQMQNAKDERLEAA